MDFLRRAGAIERATPKGGFAMYDLIYLAVGLGFFAAMSAYARWASQA